ncbi:GEVED domain-containing protein [Epilithonimonas caeni]|uniref:GEVED domain-containing protein n=1 Tax=Epilithonimonas caeni TaxID=365343 RepID=UPI000410AFCA|nr:GEVED domain-containing protein [Epilithonimonas caeni]
MMEKFTPCAVGSSFRLRNPEVLLVFLFAVFFSFNLKGQNTITFTGGTFSFQFPPNVSTAKIVAIGGGGGGGGTGSTSGSIRTGGGGGGGASATLNTFAVTNGAIYAGSAGSAGTANSTAAGGAGGDSYWINTTTLLAKGGSGGGATNSSTGGTAGAGGLVSGSIGDAGFVFSGGNGAAGSGSNAGSGGGGGSGGSTGAGGNASGATAGSAGSGGGFAGAAGLTGNGAGNSPTIGGGGSGSYAGNANTVARAGGAGGAGRISITYTGYCRPISTSATNTYINSFSTTGGSTNISKSSTGFGAYGYQNHYYDSAGAISITAGASFTATFNLVGGTAGVAIWIDWNNDGVFATSERVYNSASFLSSGNTTTGSITVPVAQAAGNYVMRIVTDFNNTNPDSCSLSGTTTRGEGEDYMISISAAPTCTTPSAQPTVLTFGITSANSIAGSFSGVASPNTPSGYMVVRSTSATAPTPVNGTTYAVGSTVLGTGTYVVQNSTSISFTDSSLTSNTIYYYYVFSYNNSCTGAPYYLTTSPLTGNKITCAAAPTAATTPVTSITSNSATINWVASVAGGSAGTINYTVEVYTDSGYTTAIPGSPFNAGTSTAQNITFSNAATTYYYRIKANNGSCDSTYLTGSFIPACAAPTSLAASATSTATGITSVTGSFTATSNSPAPTGYVVVRSTSSSLPSLSGGATYTVGANSSVAPNGYIEYVGTSAGSWTSSGLSSGTAYYYFVFSYNNTSCSSGPLYSASATQTNATTNACPSFSSVISIGGSTTTPGSLYPTLTAAIMDLSACGITQATTLSLNSSYASASETFPIVIPNIAGTSATNTLTIKPASGVSPLITSALANNAIIRLSGAQYVIIDGSNTVGGVTKDMTIRNTSATGTAVLFINGASSNTVKNNVINAIPSSSATYLGVITFYSGSGVSGNNSNIVQNNNIAPQSATLPYIGVYNYGSSTSLQNTENSILKNNIYNFSFAGVYDNGYSSGFVYDGNNIYGTATQTTNTGLYGVFLGANTIYGPIISNNRIYDLKTTNTNTSASSTGYLHGIDIYDIASGSTCYVYNNMISLAGNGAGAPGIRIAGIADESTAGTSYIYYNSISINGTASSSTGSYAYLKNYTNSSVVKNNIFSNTRISSGSGTQYSMVWTEDGTFSSDYNNIYSSGNANNILAATSTNQTALAAWQTATGQDSHSINSLPPFVSATDLHIVGSACTALESAGTPIASITNDIDNDTRSATTPDIGADEFNGNIPPKVASVVSGSNCGAGTVSLTANGSTTGAAITEYRWYSALTGGTLVGTSGNNVWVTPSISATTNYYVVAYNGCESETRTLVTATINPAPTAVSVTTTTSPAGGDACTTDYVKLEATGGVITTNVTSGTGASTSAASTTGSALGPNPMQNYYGGTKQQWIYRASELSALGLSAGSKIKSIQLNLATANASYPLLDLRIKMKKSATTAFATTSSWESGLTTVRNNASYTPSVGLNSFVLDTPFEWDGTSNLIIEMNYSNNNGGSSTYNTAKYSNTSFVSSIFYRVDNQTATTVDGYTGAASYTYSSRNDLVFEFESQKVSWTPATGLYTDAALTTPYSAGDFTATLYAAPNGTQAYTAKATLGTCDKTAVVNVTKNKREFTGNVDNSWNNANNWYPNQIPDNSKCANIPAGKTVVIDTNAETSHLIIAATGKTTISANSSLKVTDVINITNNANNDNLVLESDAVLLQDNPNAVNTGNIYAKRDVKMRQKDYTYWSSPVQNQVLLNTSGGASGPLYTSGGFSEGTPNNRIYQYKEPNDTFVATADANFVNAKGYAIRGKDSYDISTLTTDNTLKFVGSPNNGDITIGIQKSKNTTSGANTYTHGYNLIGNPYPSNIDFIKFYNLDQGNGTKNSDLINAKAWFWTNITPVATQAGSNYSGNNYATITLSGGTPATGIDTTTGTPTPNEFIKVAQGFIVEMKGTAPTGSTPITGTLKFDNSIRTNNSTGHFYNNNKTAENGIDRYWVKLISPESVVNTILVAHIAAATNQYDADYDADLLTVGDDSFYTKLDAHKLQIQGRNVLGVEDVIPLGTKYSINGTYKIGLGNKEGIFSSAQKVYLHDKLANTYTDLTEKDYTFSANKGVDDTRFELVYKSQDVLGTNISMRSNFTVYRDGDFYVVKSTKKLGKVEMYDTSGRIIRAFNTPETMIKIDMNDVSNGVYVLKVENAGEAKTHKIIK